ncbi:MAG: hypothetical protein MUF31_13410 [Akkermansiaceae bacterium]|jgi:hypothetical protein|nr:hypothetical protein [Akkermansiaceae bacterium]
MPVAEPHKELRFTRARQAVPFWIAAAMGIAATLALVIIGTLRQENPDLPHPLWALLPATLAVLLIRIALRCTRHAYIILSPLGVEIFPFFQPAKNMQLVPWAQITHAEAGDHFITLHFDADQQSGIHLALDPIPTPARPLLAKAILGRVAATTPSSPPPA